MHILVHLIWKLINLYCGFSIEVTEGFIHKLTREKIDGVVPDTKHCYSKNGLRGTSENEEVNSENEVVNSENEEVNSENEVVNFENEVDNSENKVVNSENEVVNFEMR